MVKKYRTHSKEFKLKIVDEYLNGAKSQVEIGKVYGIHPVMISRWVRSFQESGESSYPGKGHQRESKSAEKCLEKKISDLKLENEILKKAMAIFSERQN